MLTMSQEASASQSQHPTGTYFTNTRRQSGAVPPTNPDTGGGQSNAQ